MGNLQYIFPKIQWLLYKWFKKLLRKQGPKVCITGETIEWINILESQGIYPENLSKIHSECDEKYSPRNLISIRSVA